MIAEDFSPYFRVNTPSMFKYNTLYFQKSGISAYLETQDPTFYLHWSTSHPTKEAFRSSKNMRASLSHHIIAIEAYRESV